MLCYDTTVAAYGLPSLKKRSISDFQCLYDSELQTQFKFWAVPVPGSPGYKRDMCLVNVCLQTLRTVVLFVVSVAKNMSSGVL